MLPTLSLETRDCATAPSKRSAFKLRQHWDVNGIAQRSAFLVAVNLGGWQSHSNAVPAAGLAVTRAASGAGDSKRRASASWKALTGKRRKHTSWWFELVRCLYGTVTRMAALAALAEEQPHRRSPTTAGGYLNVGKLTGRLRVPRRLAAAPLAQPAPWHGLSAGPSAFLIVLPVSLSAGPWGWSRVPH